MRRHRSPFAPISILTAAALTVVLAAVSTTARAAASGPPGTTLVERFAADPFTGQSANPFFAEGEVAAHFAFLPAEPPHFPGDRPGTLRVIYDTTLPSARISTPIGGVLTADADFDFGAILTIRSAGFAADPNGFSQITFALWNSVTTGMNRTGFPSDSFDALEFDYFANVGDFGGPFLSPSVFGGDVGAGNAFFNFTFQSRELALPADVPLLCRFHHAAATRLLTLTVSRHGTGVFFEPIPGAVATIDLSTLSPGFQVDVAGIMAWYEGWASLRAEVDFDLLYVGALPAPFGVGARRRTTLAGSSAHGRGAARSGAGAVSAPPAAVAAPGGTGGRRNGT